MDDAHLAELEFMEESEKSDTRVSGQFRTYARKDESALNSIKEDWAKDAYKKTQNMEYFEVKRQW